VRSSVPRTCRVSATTSTPAFTRTATWRYSVVVGTSGSSSASSAVVSERLISACVMRHRTGWCSRSTSEGFDGMSLDLHFHIW
jgi:hypothetical protein